MLVVELAHKFLVLYVVVLVAAVQGLLLQEQQTRTLMR
jgi:hypothetical protein